MSVDPDLDIEQITITDRMLGARTIIGWKIGHVSSLYGSEEQRISQQDRPRVRWAVNTVMKLREGAGYVLVREAYSRVYHRRATECRTAGGLAPGERMTVQAMKTELGLLGLELDDAVPCRFCRPAYPDELRAADRVRYEMPRRSIDRCEDRAQVVQQLTNMRRFSGVRSTEVGEPVKELLEQCLENDPDWALADLPVETIG